MEKQPESRKTLGQAIDEIVHALNSLDQETQVTAIRAACDHLKIRPPEGLGAKLPSSSGAETIQTGAPSVPSGPVDIKSLKQQKQPSSANEMAALVAFYLSETAPEDDRKTAVEQEDMIKYFKQAGFPLPKVTKVLLTNAKNAGYFDAVGSGKYRLNAVGYNLVAYNLPRGQSEAASGGRKRQRKAVRRPRKQKPET